nr:hypothetical protein [Tanacetum cinerariifolium]
MDGLTLDGSFIPHSNFLVYREEEQEPETITKVVEIPSSESTPLVSPLETLPLFAPEAKENPEPNSRQLSIPYPSQLQKDKFQALENPTGCHYTLMSIPKKKSSSSTTSYSDHSLPEYKSFYFDIDLKEFKDLIYHGPSIDPPPIVERSDSHHEEFADELAHIISPPKYDPFYFDIKVDPRESTRLFNEKLSSKIVNLTKIIEDNELKFQTSTELPTTYELNVLHLLLSNIDSTLHEKFSEIDPLESFPFTNDD